MAKKSDATNLIAILLAIFGFLALYAGFQSLQSGSAQNSTFSFVVGVIAFIIAYYISNK